LKQNILYAPLPDLDRIRPSIHPVVQAILRKCLQKNPNDRYESAKALVSDLKKVILEPVREPGPSLSPESKKVYEQFKKRYPNNGKIKKFSIYEVEERKK